MDSKDNKNKSDDEILEAKLSEKAKELGVPYLYKIPKKIDKNILNLISENVASKYQMVAFDGQDDSLRVAMVDTQNIEALNILRFISQKENLKVEIYLTTPEKIKDVLVNYSSPEKVVEEAAVSLEEEIEKEREKRETGEGKMKEVIQDAPVSKLVEVILNHAIEGRASDIHIEPVDDKYRVRFRVDGILHASLVLPKGVGKAVVARVKILSNLKIDEQRKPQDGRFQVRNNGKITDFRVSTFPVIEGEKTVMRVLNRNEKAFDLESLGLLGRNYEIFERRIKDPYGIILITGPTGSGKSTTLYGFLKILNQDERNIVTLEDPVEYYISGINQSQVKPEIGYTFANGLRSILRQDPNVIMVGEIRDSETAELAIHAALTGHLVFSTLHTNNAIGALPRLFDMGVEPFLLSSSMRIVAAQRLVRRICEHCREEVEISDKKDAEIKKELEGIPEDEIKKYNLDLSKKIKFYQGKGCEECGNLGYQGRIAIYEVLEISDEIREIISEKGANEAEIENIAKKEGWISIRQDGILKVLLGITTLSEIDRVTKGNLKVGGDEEDF